MKLTFTGQNVEVTDALRSLITEKFEKVERHFDQPITSAKVILSIENLDQTVEMILHIAGAEICAKGHDEDMYKAADKMIQKLDRQLRRHKSKLQDRRKEK